MGCAQPRVLSQGRHGINGLGLFGWECCGNGDGIGNYSTGEGGWMGVPESRRAQSQRVAPAGIQARNWNLLEAEGVWRVPEVEAAAGKSSFMCFAWICIPSVASWHHLIKSADVPTQIQHSASSSRGKLVWKDLLGKLGPLVPKALQGSLAPMAFVGFLVQL